MDENPLNTFKPPGLFTNPIIKQAHHIKNSINFAILENKKHISLTLTDDQLYPTNKILLEDNGFIVNNGWLGSNMNIDGLIYSRVYQYDIFWM
jgi:hypothetical protein